jgi:acetolactate synthase I/II/III large subunit
MLAGRIAAIGGADLLCDTFFARMERGGGLPSPMKLPYFPDEALELIRRYERVIVAGTRRPVAFLGYPGLPSYTNPRSPLGLARGRRRQPFYPRAQAGSLTALGQCD